MKKVFLYKIYAIILLATCVIDVAAQDNSTKHRSAAFPMTDIGQISVENKYGNIKMVGWDVDSVVVQVDIKIDGEDDDVIKRLNPKFDYSQEYLHVETLIEPQKHGYINRWLRRINPIDNEKSHIDVDILLKVPRSAQLRVTNRYGDLIISNCRSRLRADMQHGDVRISGMLPHAEISISYGTLRAFELIRGDINVQNGELDIGTIEHLELTSSGSSIEIDSVQTWNIKSSRDKLFASSVFRLKGEMRYSDAMIEQVGSMFDLQLHQSDLKILSLSKFVSTLYLDQTASDVELNGSGLGLDIQAHLTEGLLRLPKSVAELDVKMIDDDDEIRDVTAKYGQSPFIKLSITGRDGFILIK